MEEDKIMKRTEENVRKSEEFNGAAGADEARHGRAVLTPAPRGRL